MWLDELKKQIKDQEYLSTATKLTPDADYRGMFYAVHPNWFDRLIAIAEGAKHGAFGIMMGKIAEVCPICYMPKNLAGNSQCTTDCPYHEGWKP